MADGIEYDVFATLKVAGAATFNADMGRAAKSADELQESFDRLGDGAQRAWSGISSLGGMAASVASKMVAVGTAATMAAAVGAGAAAVHVGKNLSMLENKSIQLTSVVAAATEQGFADVIGDTNKLFQQFKSDAVVSAGETENFIDTASKIAGPLLGAGKSMADLREITKGVISTAPALGVAFEQAGSDVMRMLQGGAGADLPFFQALQSIPSLGIKSAEAFNQMAIDKRIEIIRKALTNPAFLAASNAAGDSFSGLMSTTQDLLKTMGGLVVSPAFDVAKRGLKSLTSTLMEGLQEGGPVRTSLFWLGNTLGVRFGQIGDQLGRMFPDLNGSLASTVQWVDRLADQGLAKVVSATSWVATHWPEIADGAREFAGWVANAADRAVDMVRTLGGGDLTKGLERAALLYGAMHVAGPAANIASGASQMASGAASAGRWAWGLFGAGGAATAATGAGAAGAAGATAAGATAASTAAATGAGAAAGSGAASGTAAAAGVAAGPVAAIAAAIGAVLLGAYKVITDSPYWSFGEYIKSKLYDASHEFERFKVSIAALWDRLSTLGRAIVDLGRALWPFVELIINMAPPVLAMVAAWTAFSAALDPALQGLTAITEALQGAASYLTMFAHKVTDFVDAIADKLGIRKGQLAPVDEDLMRDRFAVTPDARFGAPVISTSGALSPGSAAPKKPPAGGKQSVEVTIKWDLGEGNEDAIYVRSRKDITAALKSAQNFVRASPLPGRF